MPTSRLVPLCGALAIAASTVPLRAQDLDSVRITTTRVADGVYLLQGSGGNIGVSTGGDGVFVIDDQYAPLNARIRAAIQALSPGPIRFVINTHWHGDHTGGNESFGRDGVLIVAHENVRRRKSAEQFIAAFNARVPPSPAAALPVVTFSDSVSFYLNGDTIRVIHMQAAHTDGDAVIVFPRANVVHTGDMFFNGFYPFIDASTGGALDGMIAATDRILAIADDDTRIIPGHGPLATRADLRRYRDMLATVRLRLSRAIREGKTAEQVAGAGLLSDLDTICGRGFLNPAQFVTAAYQSMGRR